jgi:hypothetical protein
MPKKSTDIEAEGFGKRLVALLEAGGQARRGAGTYLSQRYKVSTVTANDWLNGRFKPNTETARQIAVDHGSTFDALYFGRDPDGLQIRVQEGQGHYPGPSHSARVQRLTMRAAARIIERAREFIIGDVDEDALIDNAIDAAIEIGPERILEGDGLHEGVRLVAAKMKAA